MTYDCEEPKCKDEGTVQRGDSWWCARHAGSILELYLLLPTMRPNRWRAWGRDARDVLKELAFDIHSIEAAACPSNDWAQGGVLVRIRGRGNCWTYDFDEPHIIALCSMLGSDPKMGLPSLVHGLRPIYAAWTSAMPDPDLTALVSEALRGVMLRARC